MLTKPDFEKKQILFVTTSYGDKISFKNDNLIVKNKDGEVKYQVTCYRIFALFIIGHFTLTTGIIQRSHKFGFPIFLMTNSLKIYDYLGARMEGNVLLRRHQYNYEGMDLGVYLIENKVSNQRNTLNFIRKKSDCLKEDITKLDQYLDKLKKSTDIDELMGYEGIAAKIYFKHVFDSEGWSGRNPRIKGDFINSTLDIGYTMLFNIIDSLLMVYGFDVYCGVLHRQFYMRKSLVCDIMEPFRPIIDWQVRRAIHLKQCKIEDFELINHQYVLKWQENKKYIKFLMEPILYYKIDIFLYIQSYYRAFMRNKRIEEYPRFDVR